MHTREGLVEDEDVRIQHQEPGELEKLSLSAESAWALLVGQGRRPRRGPPGPLHRGVAPSMAGWRARAPGGLQHGQATPSPGD